MKTGKISTRAYVTILIMGVAYAAIYSIPYIKSIFYDGMIALTGTTNAQLGLTMTIYGLGEVLTPGIGGILAEKFDYKKIILISPMFTAAACLVLAFFPSYTMVLIAWVVVVFSTLFMIWGSLFKAIRLLGSDSQQGTINGLYAAAMGLGYLIVNVLGIFLYDKYAETNPAYGMQVVFVGFAIVIVVFSILSYFCLKATPTVCEDEKAEETNVFKAFGVVAKEKGVWFFGGLMFFLYSTNISMQYFTPYFSDVLGVSVVFGGVLAIVRQYGMRFIAGPLGGKTADRIGSIAKVMVVSFAFMAVSIVLVIFLPNGLRTVTFMVGLLLMLAFFNNVGMGLQYAIISEGKVPRVYTAAAIGMGTMLGYSPDIYQHVLFGSWLDKFGAAGYTYIFIYGLVSAVLGVILMLAMLHWKKTESYKLKVM
ncbi:MAG: MFS transporter [Oscillospiraceae bacterium]